MAGAAMKIALTFTAVDAASGALRLLENKILGLGKAGKQVKKDFESMVSNMQSGVKSLAVSWVAFEKLKPFVSTAANVQEALLEMKMTLATAGKDAGRLADELERVERVADVLQKKTPFSSLDIIKAETAFKKAGIDINDITNPKGAAYASATLATIAGHGMTPETVAEIMTHVAIPFHVKGEAYGEMADLFQRVITNSTLDLPGFGSGMANFGGIASNLGLDMKRTAQALMTVGEAVRDPAAAGTYLKNFLLAISAPTKGEKEAQEDAGFRFWNKGHHLKNWDQIISELQGKTAGMGDDERADTLRKAFQMRGLEAVLPLVNRGMGSYKEAGQKLASSGDIDTKLGIALEGLNRNVTSLSGTVETAISNTFKPMLSSLTEVTMKANDAADAFGRFAAEHQKEFGYAEAGGVAALGGLGLYGLFRMGKGLRAGGRVLRGLRGLVGTGAEVAEGKALQATAGVTPVFVVGGKLDGMSGIAGGASAMTEVLRDVAPAAVGASLTSALAPAAAILAPLGGLILLDHELREHGMTGKSKLWTDFGDGGKPKSWADMEGGHGKGALEMLAADKLKDSDRRIEDAVHGVGTILREKKNITNIYVNVDQNGRVTSHSDDASATTTINLKRGEFMPF
jgi:TP901 family phage tail tape measure protein